MKQVEFEKKLMQLVKDFSGLELGNVVPQDMIIHIGIDKKPTVSVNGLLTETN